ncbi:NADP(H)-dependent aldo-keto reductase [Flavobacterium psychrotolerans]|uniref:Protein tas n=1 Tax=Flavobacterium psychrotolerans TaxID=2169410 RepID=A0A2U1JJZ8_9FLAO|nr:NADP(H)-dependent aldo-keto reductase [Flavobacterium psychrotolerans]PWA05208.1 NADP(H)-dependent aldo-keto reductase [Flavobacterium psychrotolerans]
MKYTILPNTNIEVSKICLGTMTFGEQNTEADGHAQMDFALANGINFIDTAEMYSVPGRKETYGSTEKIIGTWFKKSGNRDKVILASKIAGPNPGLSYIRENMDFSSASIALSIEKSLTRLQTDYIDLYQLHWPERKTNFFGQRGFKVQNDAWEDNIHEVLETLDRFIKEGKINHVGLSNETPWGIMRFLEENKHHNLPRIKTVQNPYSLLNRLFENGSAEVCLRENVGLLAYSPLAFGVLSGKFLNGKEHPNSRIKLFPQFSRYNSAQCAEATRLYQEIASKNGLTLTEMSLAFLNQQPFVTSTIIGATTLKQLEENIKSIEVLLSEDILREIEKVQNVIPDPAP